MNKEYEVRLLNIDKENFIKILKDNQAEYIGKWIQKRYIYDFKPVDENRWIRLRTNGEKTTLTIKEYHENSVSGVEELEIEVNDFDKTDLLLEKLGYIKRSIQENRRIRYILDTVEIDIDTWPGLNTYVEFEGKCEEDIMKVFNRLGLDYSMAVYDNVQDIYLSEGYTLEELNNLKLEEEYKNEI